MDSLLYKFRNEHLCLLCFVQRDMDTYNCMIVVRSRATAGVGNTTGEDARGVAREVFIHVPVVGVMNAATLQLQHNITNSLFSLGLRLVYLAQNRMNVPYTT